MEADYSFIAFVEIKASWNRRIPISIRRCRHLKQWFMRIQVSRYSHYDGISANYMAR